MLSAVIIAKNEERNIRRCLESLSFCSEILVLDDNSQDKTADIARSLGARVEHFNSHNDYSAIRNQGLDQVTNKWVIFIDSDEIVSPALSAEIQTAITQPEFKGYLLHRVDHLWGRVLHHGDVGSVNLLRLGRKTAGNWVGNVHETWNMSGRVGRLSEVLDHYPHPTLNSFLASINRYSSLRSQELYKSGVRAGLFQIIFYPLAKFIYLWVIKAGFLDGFAGLVHALTMSFYSFLVRGKLYLIGKKIPDPYFD
jgi:glycosyltransferase involved in cell wall biosynthesis